MLAAGIVFSLSEQEGRTYGVCSVDAYGIGRCAGILAGARVALVFAYSW